MKKTFLAVIAFVVLLMSLGLSAAYVRHQYTLDAEQAAFIHEDNTDNQWIELCLLGRDLLPTGKSPEQDARECAVQVRRAKAKYAEEGHE